MTDAINCDFSSLEFSVPKGTKLNGPPLEELTTGAFESSCEIELSVDEWSRFRESIPGGPNWTPWKDRMLRLTPELCSRELLAKLYTEAYCASDFGVAVELGYKWIGQRMFHVRTHSEGGFVLVPVDPSVDGHTSVRVLGIDRASK